MDRRTLFLLFVGITVCIVAVAGQTPIGGRGGGPNVRDRGGGFNRPTRPATRPPTKPPTNPSTNPEPVAAPSVKSALNVAGRRRSGTTESAKRVAASLRAPPLSDDQPQSSRGFASKTASLPGLFQAQPAENQLLAKSMFKQGSQSVSPDKVASGAPVQSAGASILIFIGPTQVIIYGFSYPIQGGKINYNGYYYLVCGYTLALESSYICCDGDVHDLIDPSFPEDGPRSCCAKGYYYPKYEICCPPRFHIKYNATLNADAECCGETYYYPTSARKEICCSGMPYYDDDTGCCKGQAYDKSKYCCHNNLVYFNWASYCGGCQDSVATRCCNGVQYNKLQGYECCDKKYMNTYQRTCCNKQEIVTASTGCCANTTPYNRQYQKCCNGEVKYAQHDCAGTNPCTVVGAHCCEGTPYNQNTQQCCKKAITSIWIPCYGDVCSYVGEGCCNGKTINAITHGCCGASTYNKANEKCCKPNNVVKYKYAECVTADPCSHPNICCGGKAHVKKNGHSCCGTSYYSNSYICCNNKPILKTTYGCCNNQPFNLYAYKCCYNSYIRSKFSYC